MTEFRPFGHSGLVPVAIHFETVKDGCKYSRIAGKYLQKHYFDPYPLVHVVLQISSTVIALAKGHLISYPFDHPSEETIFSYYWHASNQTCIDMLTRFETIYESFSPYNSVTQYFKKENPWCTDITEQITFGTEDVQQLPPIEYLDKLCNSERGYLLQWHSM